MFAARPPVSDGAELCSRLAFQGNPMPDSVFADAAPRFGRRPDVPVELTGRSAAITRVHELVRRGARLDGGALITAEPGAAVEDVARELHVRSRAAAGPFAVVDCEASEPARVDQLLFGAAADREPSDLESVTPESAIAAARGGTLFLKNASELRASAQAQLARIARDGEVRIDGEPVATAVRLVASAQPGIDADVYAHRFRADLYRRLSAVRIDVPPLRDRPEDVPALAVRLLQDRCAAEGCAPRTFTQAALALFGALTWPGNLAELRTAVDRIVAGAMDDVIQIEQVLPALQLHRARTPFVPS